jgi:hypothetical protein
MGYSKKETISRDSISGLFQQNDLESGEVSVNQLRARAGARKTALNEVHTKDWTDDPNSVNSPAYGDAMSRMPKPTDYSSKGESRFGVGVTPSKQAVKRVPDSNSKQSK